MERAICWQKLSSVSIGNTSVSSSELQTALKYGWARPVRELSRLENLLTQASDVSPVSRKVMPFFEHCYGSRWYSKQKNYSAVINLISHHTTDQWHYNTSYVIWCVYSNDTLCNTGSLQEPATHTVHVTSHCHSSTGWVHYKVVISISQCIYMLSKDIQ